MAKRGRKPVEIDQTLLINTINEVEANGPLTNRSALYDAVSSFLIQRGVHSATPSVVMLRIRKGNINVKTPIGQRGAGLAKFRENKTNDGDSSERRPRMSNGAANALRWYYRHSYGKRFSNLVNKAIRGSRKAAIALKCVDCMNGQLNEIKYCPCTDCPLHPFRPYQCTEAELQSANPDVKLFVGNK